MHRPTWPETPRQGSDDDGGGADSQARPPLCHAHRSVVGHEGRVHARARDRHRDRRRGGRAVVGAGRDRRLPGDRPDLR